MKLGSEPRQMNCILLEDELAQRSQALARATQDKEAKEEEHASVKAMQKAEIAALEAEIARLATVVLRKAEPRTVEVEWRLVDGEVIYSRTDTGEILSRRAPTDEERQATLFPQD